MALDQNRKTRDYLYGRLLALAENLEGRSLNLAGEGRDTNASKLMQRFSQRPHSTWLTIELALVPYKTRLRSNRPGFLFNIEKEIDEVMDLFSMDDFLLDQPLSGEFLLSYHCQRAKLRTKHQDENDNVENGPEVK